MKRSDSLDSIFSAVVGRRKSKESDWRASSPRGSSRSTAEMGNSMSSDVMWVTIKSGRSNGEEEKKENGATCTEEGCNAYKCRARDSPGRATCSDRESHPNGKKGKAKNNKRHRRSTVDTSCSSSSESIHVISSSKHNVEVPDTEAGGILNWISTPSSGYLGDANLPQGNSEDGRKGRRRRGLFLFAVLIFCIILIVVAGSFSGLIRWSFQRKPRQNATSPESNISAHVYDVVIIGAGWAGISAAARLSQLGISNILLVEARDRIGGRSHTVTDLIPNDDVPVELGSEFVYTGNRNKVIDIFNAEGVPYVEIDNSAYTDFTLDGQVDDELAQEKLNGLFYNGFIKYARKQQFGAHRDSDYETLLDEYEKEEAITDSFDQAFLEATENSIINIEYASDSTELSVRETLEWIASDGAEQGITSFQRKGGHSAAIERYAARFGISDNILPNTVVQSIDYRSGDSVLIETKNAFEDNHLPVRATKVLVTVPLGVLKADSINFVPKLPHSKLRAMERAGFGALDKFIMYWDDRTMSAFPQSSLAWDNLMDQDWLGLILPPKMMGNFTSFFNSRSYSGMYTLTAWIAGSDARRMDAVDDETILHAHVMPNLQIIFGKEMPEPTAYRMTRWSEDEFSRGSYSYPAVGKSHSDVVQRLGEPVNNELFFAGEHTSSRWYGTTAGAFQSGRAAATSIAIAL